MTNEERIGAAVIIGGFAGAVGMAISRWRQLSSAVGSRAELKLIGKIEELKETLPSPPFTRAEILSDKHAMTRATIHSLTGDLQVIREPDPTRKTVMLIKRAVFLAGAEGFMAGMGTGAVVGLGFGLAHFIS